MHRTIIITFLTRLIVGQAIDFQALSTFPAAPTPSFAVGVSSQVINYNPAAAVAKAYTSVYQAVGIHIGTLGSFKRSNENEDEISWPHMFESIFSEPHPLNEDKSKNDAGIYETVRTRVDMLSKRDQMSRELMIAKRMLDMEGQEQTKRQLYARNAASTTTVDPNACNPEPTGAGPVSTPDTPEAFAANPKYGNMAVAAGTPDGYVQTFVNLTASNIAYAYLGYQYINAYNPNKCATLCNNMDGCSSFNLYFERDPIITPGPNCINPNSTTAIKCAFWGGDIGSYNAINSGQYRQQFHVLIAGSNGYTSIADCSNPSYPGYSQPEPLGNATILAIPDCNGYNSYLGYKFFNSGPFDFNLCASACEALSAGNLASNASAQTCQFYTAYLLNKNGVALGQYCAMYSEYWADSFATNVGQYDADGNHYTISNSYSSYNLTNPGYAQPKCWQNVPTANSVCASSSASVNSVSSSTIGTTSTVAAATISSTTSIPISSSTTTAPQSTTSTTKSSTTISAYNTSTSAPSTSKTSTTSSTSSPSAYASPTSSTTKPSVTTMTTSKPSMSSKTTTATLSSYGANTYARGADAMKRWLGM